MTDKKQFLMLKSSFIFETYMKRSATGFGHSYQLGIKGRGYRYTRTSMSSRLNGFRETFYKSVS